MPYLLSFLEPVNILPKHNTLCNLGRIDIRKHLVRLILANTKVVAAWQDTAASPCVPLDKSYLMIKQNKAYFGIQKQGPAPVAVWGDLLGSNCGDISEAAAYIISCILAGYLVCVLGTAAGTSQFTLANMVTYNNIALLGFPYTSRCA